jgi:hypothetical protein
MMHSCRYCSVLALLCPGGAKASRESRVDCGWNRSRLTQSDKKSSSKVLTALRVDAGVGGLVVVQAHRVGHRGVDPANR